MSKVPSWVPMIGSRSLPRPLNVGSFTHTFIANSNWRTRLAHPMKPAIPRSLPSSGAPSGRGGPYVPPRRIIRRRCTSATVSRGFMRRMCAPIGHAYP